MARSLVLPLLAAALGAEAGAQIRTDGTVGPAREVTPLGGRMEIGEDLGTRRGATLFHSFKRFGVPSGQSADFTGSDGLDRIVSRVTGGAASSIEGTVGVGPAGADFFFVNPAGIRFGPGGGVAMNGGGAHFSAADRLVFKDGAVFSATDVEGSILTVAEPAAFGFLERTAGRLAVVDGALLVVDGETTGLSLSGREVAIVGDAADSVGVGVFDRDADVVLAAGGTEAPVPVARPTGRALDGAITISRGVVTADGSTPFGGGAGRVTLSAAEIAIDDLSIVSASNAAGAGGAVEIEAGRLDIGGNSEIRATRFFPVDFGEVASVTMTFDVAELTEGATVLASGATGGGTVAVSGGALALRSGAAILSTGGLGFVDVDVDRLTIEGIGLRRGFGPDAPSGINVLGGAANQGGFIDIRAGEAILGDGTAINADAPGGGVSGFVRLVADTLRIDGTGQRGDAPATVNLSAFGTALPDTLFGRVELTAREAMIEGANILVGPPPPGEDATAAPGNSGTILLTGSERLTLVDSTVLAPNFGFAAPGLIGLTAGTLSLDDSVINTGTDEGGGGAVVVSVERGMRLSGTSGISSLSGDEGGGLVAIDVASGVLSLDDDATIGVSSVGDGAVGDLVVAAPEIRLSGESFLSTTTFGAGDGGGLRLTTERLVLADGAGIRSQTGNAGDAGDIVVVVTERLTVSNRATIVASAEAPVGDDVGRVDAVGSGGDIEIAAGRFSVVADDPPPGGDVAGVTARSNAALGGDAGRVVVTADKILIADGGRVDVEAVESGGGSLTLQARDLIRLSDGDAGANVATGGGDGGDVTMRATFVVIDEDSTVTAAAADGDGGVLRFFGTGTFLSPGATLTVDSRGGSPGVIEIEGVEENLVGVEALDPGFFDPRALLGDPCLAAASGRSGLSLAGGGARIAGPGAPSLFLDAVPFPDDATDGAAERAAAPRLALADGPCGR